MKILELPNLSSAGSSNLAFALLFLPPERRADALIFYRFCRAIDDIADQPGKNISDKHRQLAEWTDAVLNGLPQELEGIVSRYSIDRNLFAEIIAGCESDILPQRFKTFVDLEAYCWRVACAVGLVSIKIFGCHDSRSEAFAVHLGHALQLTNILRDVGEDACHGRIYLPLEDLARFGVSEEDILNLKAGSGFGSLIRHQAGRARTRFAAALPPNSDFKALLPARIMKAVYERILDRIECGGFAVFQGRASVSWRVKLNCILAQVILGLGKNPLPQ